MEKGGFQNITKFLKDLVTDSRLNVGPEGTNIALILFSTKRRTKVKLEMGQIQDAQQLGDYMTSLQWKEVNGSQTRTEKALNLAKKVSLHFRLFMNVWCNRMEWVLM